MKIKQRGIVIQGYDVRKAAQVVAFFILKEGNQINVLKLGKLLYLAERKFLEIFDSPILYDIFVSTNNGPILSVTYDYINGEKESIIWDKFITNLSNHEVGLAKKSLTIQKLDELCKAETEVLKKTYEKFGDMSRWELVEYTHKNCPEWENPQGTSTLIPYDKIFKFLGKKESEMLARAVEEERILLTPFSQKP